MRVSGSGALALQGAGDPWAGASCGGGAERCRWRDRGPSWGRSGHWGGVSGALGDLRSAAAYWGDRFGLQWRVLAGARLSGGPPYASVWPCSLVVSGCRLAGGSATGTVPPVWCAPPLWCASCLVIVPSPPVPTPLAFPLPIPGGAPVLPCPRVVLIPVPCPCERLPVTLGFSPAPCRRPSLRPFPFRCAGGGVVARSVGRRWRVPGDGWSGATSGGFWGCRGGGCPGPRP